MKKSTVILIITGVLCTIVSVICIVVASVQLADKGLSFAQTTVNGHEYVWDSNDNWNWHYDASDAADTDSTSPENVDVNLPFLTVHVDGDNVQVNLPGMNIDVNDKTNKVSVKIEGNDTQVTETTIPSDTAAVTTAG